MESWLELLEGLKVDFIVSVDVIAWVLVDVGVVLALQHILDEFTVFLCHVPHEVRPTRPFCFPILDLVG